MLLERDHRRRKQRAVCTDEMQGNDLAEPVGQKTNQAPGGKIAHEVDLRKAGDAVAVERPAPHHFAVFRDAPAAFLKMIVVHELAHLKEADHDKAFYQLCNHMLADYHQLEFEVRAWLCHQAAGGAPVWDAAVTVA